MSALLESAILNPLHTIQFHLRKQKVENQRRSGMESQDGSLCCFPMNTFHNKCNTSCIRITNLLALNDLKGFEKLPI